MEQLIQPDFLFGAKSLIQNITDDLPLSNLPVEAEQITEEASRILHSIATGAIIVGLIFSLAGCFFGYRLLRFWISLAGLLVGAILGYGIVWYFTDNSTYALLASAAGASILAILSYKIYLVGIFLLSGFGSGFLALAYLPLDGILLYVISIAIGIVVGSMAVIYMRPAIIVITGITNGIAALGAIAKLAALPNQTLILPLGIGLGMIGAAFQFMTTKKKKL